MMQHAAAKYRPFPPVALADRQWPNRVISAPPIWMSTDLRDGNQSLFEPMNAERKMRMFRTVCAVGFKEIEVGFPSASQTDFDFVRLLIEGGHVPDDVTIEVLTQARDHLIERTMESVRGARRVIVHVYNATSPTFRDVVFGMSRNEVVQLAVDAVRRIADLPGCLGVKDSTGDMEFYQSLVDALRDRPDLTVLMGPEEKLWDAVMMGGHGAVTGGANLAPELFTGIYAAAIAGKPEDAAPLMARSQIISGRIYSILPERSGYFRGLKCAMELRGICAGGMAAPFEPITGEPREQIRRALIDAGLL